MKFIKCNSDCYFNAAYIKEMYISTDRVDDDTLFYEVTLELGNEAKRYVGSYETREDAERALENLVRSLED
mgnify:CR=1 FL=1